MRLSNIDSIIEKIDDFPTAERRRPIESHIIQKIQEFHLQEPEKRARKSSEILLGDNSLDLFGNSIIKKYSSDLIYKKPSLTLRRKRERPATDAECSVSARSDSTKNSFYSMKTRTGLTRKIPFVENKVQKRFYEYFDSHIYQEVSLFSKSSFRKEEKHLSDFHIEPSSSFTRSQTLRSASSMRKAKRQNHNSTRLPETFFPTMNTKVEPMMRSPNSCSLRRSQVCPGYRPNTLISPFKVNSKSESSDAPFENELGKQSFVENNCLDDLPMEFDDDTPVNRQQPATLKRHLSAELLHKKKVITDRVSIGNIQLNSGRYDRVAFDLDDSKVESPLMRVYSVVVHKSKSNLNFNKGSSIKPPSKFQILEQWTKGESKLRLLVIFNETTTLKIKLKKIYSPDRADGDDFLKQESDESKKSSPNSVSDLSLHDKSTSLHSGKFKIEQMKSLMFAKDPVKNCLFEYILNYVQRYFWYDTLHRFLELVDLIYSDLVQYYSKAQKEFSATHLGSHLETQDDDAFLVVEGSIKSAKLVCSTPILGRDTFSVTSQGPAAFLSLPLSKNRKLLRKGPMSELSCSLADSLTAFRLFVSTFA